jgi:hypothetical protein
MVQIHQWFKSRQQKTIVQIQTTKTMFQIQTTKDNGSNPDNKNLTNGSKHGINVTFKLMFKIQPRNQRLKVNQPKPMVHIQPTKLMVKIRQKSQWFKSSQNN